MPEPNVSIGRPSRGTRSSRQTIVALSIMVCLAAIAAGLYSAQFRFNPAVVNFLEGPAASLKSANAKTAAASPLFPWPEDIAALTPAEHFESGTLSEKINGKAELYLSAGFRHLDCQRVTAKAEPGTWMEIFVYDMGSVANAYAVFSRQRRSDAAALNIAEFAYSAENALFLVHGPYYLEIIASEKSAESMRSLAALAQAFQRSRPVAAAAIAERDLFPRSGLDESSISLIPADAFGLSGFDRVFAATYRSGGSEETAFLSKRANPEEAQALAASYLEFLKTYGGQAAPPDDRVPGAVIISILDAYEIVFAEGVFLAGVHESTEKESAVNLAQQLYIKLKEASGGR